MSFRSKLIASIVCALLPYTANAAPEAGEYLAARQAAKAHDFAQAATYFKQALAADPQNPFLLENAIVSHVAMGQFQDALPHAKAMVENEFRSQVAHIALSVGAAMQDDWQQVLSLLETGQEIGPLVDGLTHSWALVGLGRMTDAIGNFDTLTQTAGLQSYALYNKALALAMVGDFEGADETLTTALGNGLRYARRTALAHAQILSQLGRNEDALALTNDIFGQQTDPTLAKMRAELTAGATLPFTFVNSAKDGLSEVYLIVAQALIPDNNDDYTLRYARAAMALNPKNTDAVLLAAKLLTDLGQFDLATPIFGTVSADDPAHLSAELGRSDALHNANRKTEAIAVLDALTAQYPDMPRVFAKAGDAYREAEDYDAAKANYTKALALFDDSDPLKWFIYYTRAITNHAMDDWPAAEADFRAALALNPKQPQVLNYLGYSMVELGINLDEALMMIEDAVAAEPQNGAIVDSLGWVLFQLGDYESAVEHLENAAALLPVDPIINDHLGDAFWAVGRLIEANFQWHRALSFDPTQEDAERIRRKLEIGLDAVLAEEGAPALEAKRGNN